MKQHPLLRNPTVGALVGNTKYTETPRCWMRGRWWPSWWQWGDWTMSPRCTDCLPGTSKCGLLGVLVPTVRRKSGSSTLSIWLLSRFSQLTGKTFQTGPVHLCVSPDLPGRYLPDHSPWFLYDPTNETQGAPMTPDFDYRWETVKSNTFQRTVEQVDNMKNLLAQHLAIECDSAYWVLDPRGLIKKSNLTFTVKFL